MMAEGRDEATNQKLTPMERLEQEVRLKRFLELPPVLQEGALRYADNIRNSYRPGDEVQKY